MRKFKKTLLTIISIEVHIRLTVRLSRFLYFKIPLLGRVVSLLIDRILFVVYGIDLMSSSIDVRHLSISHPGGVLLGGNGICSSGRVVVMGGVKFGGKSPTDKEYLERHKKKDVFRLGDNVVIGVNSVILGPITICDNVIIGAMSLVNCSITEPGIYVGSPVQKISDNCDESWVAHLQ